MHRPGQPQTTTSRKPEDAMASGGKPVSDDRARAAQGPILEPVSAVDNPVPVSTVAVEAIGRRTLSTAFVMIGPDGHLTVELRDGRTVVLREVVMRATDYCGVQVRGGVAGKRYCGGYGDVATARPGDGAGPRGRNPMVSDPIGAEANPVRRP